MKIVNKASHAIADSAPMMDKEGNEFVILVIKATYSIPKTGKQPRAIVPPQPIVVSDVFVGEPGLSAPLYEADFCFDKQKCDVVFNATAYPPEQTTNFLAKVQVGEMIKVVKVNGRRIWQEDWFSISPSKPETVLPTALNYGNAFGGEYEKIVKDKVIKELYSPNPIGRGYHKGDLNQLIKQEVPPLETADSPIETPKQAYHPAALSVIPRNSASRIRYAGTYDAHWRENVAPFFPEDFDARFFQSAPEDQQIEYPKGKEQVTLTNLIKDRPEVSFKLPRLDNIPVKVLMKNYTVFEPDTVVDTLYFEPDQLRFSVVWRAKIPYHKDLDDISTIAIGAVCNDWWQQLTSGRGCTSCPDAEKEKANA